MRKLGEARTALILGAVAGVVALAGCTAEPTQSSTAATTDAGTPAWADEVTDLVEKAMSEQEFGAVIMTVTDGGAPVFTEAWGESVPGVAATTDMHFRTGAVAISEIATVLLQLVDEDVVSLDDRVSQWLPDIPHTAEVTLGQLAQMTSGYADYLWNDAFIDKLFADPLRTWTTEEQIEAFASEPLVYEPGTNWNYSHTNYVLLGHALEAITGDPLEDVLQQRILDPLKLTQTAASETPEMLSPVLHAIDGERRDFLGVPDETLFFEDSTGWNPGWTLARGSFQNADVADTATLIRAIGRGDLLSQESHDLQIAPTLRGTTTALEGCPSCFVQDQRYTYGYGIVLRGDWVLQNPAFHGYSAIAAYLPDRDLAVAITVTMQPGGLTDEGVAPANRADWILDQIAPILAPGTLPQSPHSVP